MGEKKQNPAGWQEEDRDRASDPGDIDGRIPTVFQRIKGRYVLGGYETADAG